MSDPLRDLLLDALGDVEQDALVTKQHAEDLATELEQALRKRGMRVERVVQINTNDPLPWDNDGLTFADGKVYREIGRQQVDVTKQYRLWVNSQPLVERVVTDWRPVTG